MEQGSEGDGILLLALGQLGVKALEDGSVTLDNLSAELLVEIVAKGLNLISDGETKISPKLPPNVASRHRICTNIAKTVKDMGYSGDCGYNQLLYPSAKQSKDLLLWMVQKLPRNEDEIPEVVGANALLNKMMVESLRAWTEGVHYPHFCTRGVPPRNIYDHKPLRTVDGKFSSPEDADIREVFELSHKGKISPGASVLERHAYEIVADINYDMRLENDLAGLDDNNGTSGSVMSTKMRMKIKEALGAAKHRAEGVNEGASGSGKSLSDILAKLSKQDALSAADKDADTGRESRFMHATKFAQDQVGSVGDGSSAGGEGSTGETSTDTEKMEEEIAAMKTFIEETTDAIKASNRKIETDQARTQQIESDLMREGGAVEALKREILIRQKTLEMLPQASENIKKLQNICSDSSTRILNLSAEWEQTRQPLLAKLRTVKSKKGERRERCREMVEEMRKGREEMVTMIQELKEKQERAQHLADELSKLPKNINRALYTHRIMDIINSIGKQNKDIDKITNDIRDIQKTINSATMTLHRSDMIAEEMIFAAANQPKVDPPTVTTYRLLKDLRSKFDQLNGTISRTGMCERQSRELEVRIDQERQRVSLNNFKKLKEDLDLVKQENAVLIKQLKNSS